MSFLKGKGRHAALVALLVVIPLLVLFIALQFVRYEQRTTTKNIGVAVVNQDQAVRYQGKKYAVGKGVIAKLRHDNAVDWHFVSAHAAKAGLRSGRYLMAVNLPQTFSHNVTTALQQDPKPSTIQVSLSDHNNFASHLIGETVATKLRSQVVSSVQKAYDQQALAAIGELGSGVKQAHTGTEQLAAGSDKLQNGNQQVNDGLHQLLTKSGALGTGVQQLYTGSTQLSTGLDTLQVKSGTLGSGVQKLATGADQAATGADSLKDGLATIEANNAALLGGADSLQSAGQQLLAGSQQLHDALAQAADQISTQLASGKPQLDQLNDGLATLDQGVSDLAQGVNDPAMTDLDNHITDELTDAGSDAKKLQASLVELNAQVFDQTGTTSVASQLTSMKSLMDQVKKTLMGDSQILLLVMKNHPEMLSVMTKLNTLSTGIEKSMKAGGAATLEAKDALTDLGGQLQTLQTNLTDLHTHITDLKNGVNQLADSKEGEPYLTAGVRQAVTTLEDGLTQVQTGLTRQGKTTATTGAIQGSATLTAGLQQVLAGLQGTTTKQGFVPGLLAYTSGVTQASTGAKQLASGNNQLAAGTRQLNNSVPTLRSGVSQLATGGHQLKGGLATLNGSVPALQDGVAKLTAGSDQITSGGTTLNAGITKLNVKLGEGSKQVQGVNTKPQNVNHFVSPIANQTTQDALNLPLGDVLAPIVLMMVSFIGALLTELGLNRYSKNFRRQKLGTRVGIVALVLLLQAITMAAVSAAVGISLANPLATIGVLFVSGAVFATIIFAFDAWLGTVGVLATLALLFVQMIISGGLLPTDMLSGFYQGFAKLLPGTYVLDALNWSVNGLQTVSAADGILLLVFGAVFAGLLVLRRQQHLSQESA